jgi:hypothetical protein
VHAHTGVMSHLIGPGDLRRIARVDRWRPIPSRVAGASVCTDRQLVRAWMREGGEGRGPEGTRDDCRERSGTLNANTLLSATSTVDTYHLYIYIGTLYSRDR